MKFLYTNALNVQMHFILLSYPSSSPILLTGGVVLLLITVIWTGAEWDIKTPLIKLAGTLLGHPLTDGGGLPTY